MVIHYQPGVFHDRMYALMKWKQVYTPIKWKLMYAGVPEAGCA